MARFDGKTAFITGGAHGMGLATAQGLVREEGAVFVFDRDERTLQEALAGLRSLSDRVAGTCGDVRSRDDLRAALDECEQTLGSVDLCINHAGIGPSTHLLELGTAEWEEVIQTNLTGVFRVAQESARRMADRGGVILNMSSSGAIAAEPGHSHYAASKAGILALTRAMAHDLQPFGIRVCTLCPGDVETYRWSNVELKRLYQLRIAIGRPAQPEEIAAVYLYLASDDARHITGAAFIVDGGMLAWE